MRIERFDDVRAFYDRAGGFLAEREAQHCVLLGWERPLTNDPHTYGPHDPYLAAALDGDEVVGVAGRTPPHAVCLSWTPGPSVVDALADDVHAAFAADLNGVNGPADQAEWFAQRWAELTRARVRRVMAERAYEADRISLPWDVPGALRDYTADDRAVAGEWMDAFFLEAFGGVVPGEGLEVVERRLREPGGGWVLWEDGDGPVSIASYGSPTPSGIRIGPVYTPPELRGRGYASAVTARISERLLAQGRRFCFLFTDVSNPTSNSIYQRIGYRPVGDVSRWSFEL